MEFIDKEGIQFVCISTTQVVINNLKYNVNKVYFFTENEGKMLTDKHIIRFTKGKLYIYDLNQTLLGEYTKLDTELNTALNTEFLVSSDNDDKVILNKFILTPGVSIILSKGKNNKYFINDVTVSRVYQNGFDSVYEDGKNKLQISTRRHSTWNGCPIKSETLT